MLGTVDMYFNSEVSPIVDENERVLVCCFGMLEIYNSEGKSVSSYHFVLNALGIDEITVNMAVIGLGGRIICPGSIYDVNALDYKACVFSFGR
jgi:hypothetical protein